VGGRRAEIRTTVRTLSVSTATTPLCSRPTPRRVAPGRNTGSCAIASQKIVDERHGPYHSHMWWREEVRPRVRNNLYVANSSHKFKDEGYVNSFKAARYYSGKAAERRDALLEKIRKEEGSA